MKVKEKENEIPPHKRKKGKKVFKIQTRLTQAGFQRKMKEARERLEKEMAWGGWYTKYEKLKDAQASLRDFDKKSKDTHGYHYYYKDMEARLLDGEGEEVERST